MSYHRLQANKKHMAKKKRKVVKVRSSMAKRGRPKKNLETVLSPHIMTEKTDVDSTGTIAVIAPVKSEKNMLLELYATLKTLGINSIGDLEGKISRAE